jgi:hopanoid biosynthesis associated radical SAM protein HpnH
VSVTLRQSLRVAAYLAKQKVKRVERFPLLVEVEPLFQCNLACSFCGKIQYPQHILKKRMPVQTALDAIEECGAPMVSIAGGEPLVHPEVHLLAAELVRRKKFVFLCTNAILMKKKLTACESDTTSSSSVRACSISPSRRSGKRRLVVFASPPTRRS